jgi:hypothetical protein
MVLQTKIEARNKTEVIRQQAAFRINALETALAQVKVMARLESDRVNMRLMEMESTLMNN